MSVPAEAPEVLDLSRLRVLVVEDFPAMRKLVTRSLRAMGCQRILEAGDGTQATVLLEEERVDLVLSDWNMPDMGGLELLRWVRAHFEGARLPFMLVTTKGQKRDVVEAVRAGVDAYVVKPFTQEVLEAKIGRLLGLAAEFCAARDAAEAQAAQEAEQQRQARLAELGVADPLGEPQEAAPSADPLAEPPAEPPAA